MTRRRGADSPRSDSPIGPPPTRVPRIALPPDIDTHTPIRADDRHTGRGRRPAYRDRQPTLSSSPTPTMQITQSAPTNRVMRSRFFSATVDPDRLDWVPPPNSEDRPPPRP